MSRFKVLAAALALCLVSLGCTRVFAEESHPPHAEPATTAGSTAPLPLAATGGEHPGSVVEWVEGVNRGLWYDGVAAEEAARLESARKAANQPRVATGTRSGGASVECAAIAAEFGLPPWVLENESGCGADNWNGTGCGGRGCIGPTQIDLGHFANPSPWGGVGACWGLDPNVWADLIECTNRLSGGGSNLAPWGG